MQQQKTYRHPRQTLHGWHVCSLLRLWLMWIAWGLSHGLWAQPGNYTGYRLYVKDIAVVKRTSTAIKLKYTLVNTGSQPIDLSRTDQAHWVTINFDPSFFEAHLGGYRNQFRKSLFGQRLSLAPGQTTGRRTLTLQLFEPPLTKKEDNNSKKDAPKKPQVLFSAKGGEGYRTHDSLQRSELPCADLTFTSAQIVEADKRWIKVAFTLTNQGVGPAILKGKRADGADGVRVAAYVSGVPQLTRGAILIGEQLMHGPTTSKDHLAPGESLSGTFRLDGRARTRYLNVLILQLQTFGLRECDQTNNTMHLLLDE